MLPLCGPGQDLGQEGGSASAAAHNDTACQYYLQIFQRVGIISAAAGHPLAHVHKGFVGGGGIHMVVGNS